MSNAGYTDRPYAAGRGALVCVYVLGVPAMFLLLYLAVVARSMGGGISAIWNVTILQILAVTMVALFVATAGSVIVAVIRAYAADAPMVDKRATPWDAAGMSVVAARVEPPTDPWAQSDVAATDRAELAGVTP